MGLDVALCRCERVDSFRAGSYSGYNEWREQLSLMALGVMPEKVWKDPAAFEGKPFVELINFSDCEGEFHQTAGTERLATAFKEWHDRAKEWSKKLERESPDWGDFFIDRYEKFMGFFEQVAEDPDGELFVMFC